jgi:hypothetical protein
MMAHALVLSFSRIIEWGNAIHVGPSSHDPVVGEGNEPKRQEARAREIRNEKGSVSGNLPVKNSLTGWLLLLYE